MRNLIRALLRYRPLIVVVLLAWLAGGIYMFLQLDIEAYPDPSPPLVEFITQNPSWSAEEMERQVTVPVETALFGIPRAAIHALDQLVWAERCEALFRLRHGLFQRPAGSVESPRGTESAEQSDAAVVALVAHRRNLSLSAGGPELFAE